MTKKKRTPKKTLQKMTSIFEKRAQNMANFLALYFFYMLHMLDMLGTKRLEISKKT